MTAPKSNPSTHYKALQKGCRFSFSEVRAISALPFQGGVIFRTFVQDSRFGTHAMLTAMVILP
jgi:hypothetical protein